MDDFWKNMLQKTNFSAPPLDQMTALNILNIEVDDIEDLNSREVLDRYYFLYKKNDPSIGGTPYLQSKVFAAKECLMERFPNSVEL